MNETLLGSKTTIAGIMCASLVTVDMQDTVLRVEEVLNQHNLSSVPVVDRERGDCFGIISLKDVAHFRSAKRNPSAVLAWEMCTYKPLAASPQASIEDVARLMVEHRIHHVVVVQDGVLKGLVSSLDVIAAYLRQSSAQAGRIA